MKSRIVILAALGATLLLAASAAAAPPTGVQVSVKDQAATVTWSLAVDSYSASVAITKTPDPTANWVDGDNFALDSKVTSWTSGQLPAGRYYAEVAATGPGGDTEWSSSVPFTVPKPAAPVPPAIVVNRGMRGITLGMTLAQAKAKLPELEFVQSSDQPGDHFAEYGLKSVFSRTPKFSVTLASTKSKSRERVSDIRTITKAERINGVGVGSTESQVKKAVPKLHCANYSSAWRNCDVGPRKLRVGTVFTRFEVSRRVRRVSAVDVCRVVRFEQGFPTCF